MGTSEYEVEIGGLQHTVLLSDDDAKAQGLKKPSKAEPKAEPAAKAASSPNKARTAANK